MRRSTLLLVTAAAMVALMPQSARAAQPSLRFTLFAHTNLRLADIVWTGTQFLYVDNTTNAVSAAGPAGSPLTPFAKMPRQVEETRCAVAPAGHGYSAGAVYCHAPDNRIFRLSANGKTVTLFAHLPSTKTADGALTFDSTGRFDYQLVVATGRSGAPKPAGGTVFTISPAGAVHTVGSYAGPGGADEVAVAPAGFGTAAGAALLTVDAGHGGAVVAMGADGHSQTIATLPDGPNPIMVLSAGASPAASGATPGAYVTDTLSRNVFMAPLRDLVPYSGDVLVGSELRALFWIIRPQGKHFQLIQLQTNLSAKSYNLEGGIFLSA